jgi:hypothetical protein
MRYLKYLSVLVLIASVSYWLLSADSSAESASAEGGSVVYLCRESQGLFRLPAQPVPALNPETGRATLYRALYCPTCRKWQPVPPADVFPGNPLSYPCPKHQRTMRADGPMSLE